MKKRIIFAGLHKETLPLLYEGFDVVGVAHIDFFLMKTFNPFNHVFKLIYALRKNDRFRFLESLMLKFWMLARHLSSSYFFDYRFFLEALSRNRTRIIDFADRDNVERIIKDEKIDLLLVNTWEMLPKRIVFAPILGTVNVHPSKLPKYRGALPTLWSLKNNDSESAITYMLLDNSMDGGRIIKQRHFALSNEDDWLSIENKATKVIVETIIADLTDYVEGRIQPYDQDLTLVSFTDRYEEYRKIDWYNETAKDVYNKINLYPFVEADVFCYTYYRGQEISIRGAKIRKKDSRDDNRNKFFISGLTLCVDMETSVIEIRLFRDIDIILSFSLLFSRSASGINLG